MTCATTRQRLLNSERPDRAPADVQPHLAACSACRAWQRQLTRIERQIPDLPVPPSAPPADFLRHILRGPTPQDGSASGPSDGSPPWWVSAAAAGSKNGTPPWWVTAPEADRQRPPILRRRHPGGPGAPSHDPARRKVAVAFAATLGLAVFSLCWGLSPHAPPDGSAPQTAHDVRQARFDRLVATARTPNERIHVLADFVDELKREALSLSGTPKRHELPAVAAVYVKVVRERLPNYAKSLPREERVAILTNLADQFQRTESDIARFLNDHRFEAGAESLHEIAVAALEGQKQLQALLAEG